MRFKTGMLGAVAVLALSTPAPAVQEGSDDAELARALTGRGWFDWAEELCKKIQSSSTASPEDKTGIPLLMAEISLERGNREPDMEKAKEYLAKALDIFKKFSTDHPTHPQALQARINTGWLLTRKAQLLIRAMESESAPDRAGALKKEADQTYTDAEKMYEDLVTQLKAAPSSEAVFNALMDTRMELPKAMIEHAKLPGLDETARKNLLTKARALLVDFEFDYGDRPIAFQASLETGRCYLEMGDYKLAEKKLNDTLALRDRLAEAGITPNDFHFRIIYDTYVALAQLHIRQGKPAEAKAFVDKTLKDNRGLEKEWVSLALKLEKAEALFRMRDLGGANALANEIMRLDPNGRWSYLAREKVRNWARSSGGAIRVSPEQMMATAESNLDRLDLRGALTSLRRCVELCATDAERQKYVPAAYFKMGQCFRSAKRNYEAALVFENLFVPYPKHELAPKACYEAALCYVEEFAISGDKRDEQLMDKFMSVLVEKYPDDPVTRNIVFIQAKKAEDAGELKKAADMYLKVSDKAEAYENALVAAAYCLRADASKKWDKNPKDPAVQKEAKEEFRQAEEALNKFLARLNKPELVPSIPELARARAGLTLVANQELAYVYMHDAVGRTADALAFLERVAKDIPPDDERLSRIWATQIQAHLSLKQPDQAVVILESLFDRFPDSAAVVRASKSVAIRLDEVTEEMRKQKADPAVINENLKKISKYYTKWIERAPALGMRMTMQDVLSVAEALYMIAKRINGLDDNTISFLDLKGRAIAHPKYFLDAAIVHTVLVEGQVGRIQDRDRVLLMTRLARCYSFTATTADEWEKAKVRYEAVVKSFKLLDMTGQIDIAVLQAQRPLLGVYLELGHVLFALGTQGGQKFQFDNASTVFSNVMRVTEAGSEPWWLSKYMVLATLFERGGDADIKLAKVAIENLERNSPDFDGGKYGIKEKCLELKGRIAQVTGQ